MLSSTHKAGQEKEKEIICPRTDESQGSASSVTGLNSEENSNDDFEYQFVKVYNASGRTIKEVSLIPINHKPIYNIFLGGLYEQKNHVVTLDSPSYKIMEEFEEAKKKARECNNNLQIQSSEI